VMAGCVGPCLSGAASAVPVEFGHGVYLGGISCSTTSLSTGRGVWR
jgi:hypothetical protein